MQRTRRAFRSEHPRFNPHPARRPDATTRSPPPGTRGWLTFQSSSSQKAGCNNQESAARHQGLVDVSILIQPEGRMQHSPAAFAADMMMFQSSSSQKAGCNRGASKTTRGSWSFNPHPARRPDATTALRRAAGTTHGARFNPHPARRPDATLSTCSALSRYDGGFNPHPARRPDATWTTRRIPQRRSTGFNPHPARRPDATLPVVVLLAFEMVFQSSSSQKAGCNVLGAALLAAYLVFQSSSSQKAGCNPTA